MQSPCRAQEKLRLLRARALHVTRRGLAHMHLAVGEQERYMSREIGQSEETDQGHCQDGCAETLVRPPVGK